MNNITNNTGRPPQGPMGTTASARTPDDSAAQAVATDNGATRAAGAMTAPHRFSEHYQQRKQALLAEVAAAERTGTTRHRARKRRTLPWRVAAVAAALCVALPVGAYAVATHAGLFDDAFGTGFRQSVPATQAVQGSETGDVTVTMPAIDYVDVDAQTAESLIGPNVCDQPVSVTSSDGHRLTITSAVRSGHALVYAFTLERPDGVNALTWSQTTNRTKGAMVSDEARMAWSVAGDEFIYIDPAQSTGTRLVGYAYAALDPTDTPAAGQPLHGVLVDSPVPFAQNADGTTHDSTFTVPCTQVVPSTTFAADAGATMSVSALGLALDAHSGLFHDAGMVEQPAWSYPDGQGGFVQSEQMMIDPVYIHAVRVSYADGNDYVVFDNDANVNNTSSMCAYGTTLSAVFNRLVDPSAVTAIEVTLHDPTTGRELADDDRAPVKVVTFHRA